MQRDRAPPNPLSGEPFRLVDLDEDHAKAVAFNMLFVVWRKRTLGPAYRRSMTLVRDLSAQFSEGVGVCQLVEVDASPPDSDARGAFLEFMKLDTVKHFSVIHDGTGFKAASVRAVMSSVYMLSRAKFKFAVHNNVLAAAAWHTAAQHELGRRDPVELVERVIRGLRQLHRDRYPD